MAEAKDENLLLIDPEDIALPQWMDRNQDRASIEEELAALVYSVQRYGQQQPGVVRPAPDGVEEKYQLVAGSRRLLAARKLNRPFEAICRDLSDSEAYLIMVSENDDRDAITEFERAVSFDAAIKAEVYDSQSDLIDSYNADKAVGHIEKAKLSKMLTAVRLLEYEWFTKAALDIWGLKINPTYTLVNHCDEPEYRMAAKTVCERQVAKSGEGSIKASALVKECNAAIKKLIEPAVAPRRSDDITGSRGQVLTVTDANLVFRVPKDLAENATRDQLREYFEELLPNMVMAYHDEQPLEQPDFDRAANE